MSDCRNGGRTVYEKPIRGFVHFSDETKVPLSYSRFSNGGERAVVSIEIDGVIYKPEGDKR